jgi:hypothetical protein
MRPMRVDTSRFPLVLATMDGKQTRDDLDFYLSELEALNQRGETFALVTHIVDYAAEFSHAKRFGEWSKANEETTAKLCVGASAVIPSDLIRLMFSAFYLVAQVRFPFIVSKTLDEAERWAIERLREHGLTPGNPSGAT